MEKLQPVCCFILFSMVLVPTLGAVSITRKLCNQKEPSKMVPWHLRNDVENGNFDILNLERPPYLKNFKNPCWKEQTEEGEEIRCLPYFFIAGVAKYGTTDLWKRIGLHPNVSTQYLDQEPHWWAQGRYNQQRRSIDYYVKIFQPTAEYIEHHPIEKNGEKFYPLITGEGSPDTLWKMKFAAYLPQNCPNDEEFTVHQAHLIKHLIPKAKIIVTLRNPVETFFSSLMYFKVGERKIKNADHFHKIAKQAIADWSNCTKHHTEKHCALGESAVNDRLPKTLYVIHLKEWLNVFPRDQIYVSQLEEYRRDKLKEIEKIYRFLELDPLEERDFLNDKPVKNARRSNGNMKMKDETRHMLEEFYRPYNLALSQLLQDKKWLYECKKQDKKGLQNHLDQ